MKKPTKQDMAYDDSEMGEDCEHPEHEIAAAADTLMRAAKVKKKKTLHTAAMKKLVEDKEDISSMESAESDDKIDSVAKLRKKASKLSYS